MVRNDVDVYVSTCALWSVNESTRCLFSGGYLLCSVLPVSLLSFLLSACVLLLGTVQMLMISKLWLCYWGINCICSCVTVLLLEHLTPHKPGIGAFAVCLCVVVCVRKFINNKAKQCVGVVLGI